MRFVDTSFWVALFFSKDTNHRAAKQVWEDNRGPLMSTNHILGEVWTFTRRRGSHEDAVRALDAITGSRRVTVLRVGEVAEQEAWEWLRRHPEREYSFVDATSFAVMRGRGVSEALVFDADFAAAGFVQIRP